MARGTVVGHGREEAAAVRVVLWRAGLMVAGYLAYVPLVFLLPERGGSGGAPDAEFLAGRSVWLQGDCQACHSVYGLGGHNGPDLTNAWSRVGEGYIRQVVETGAPGMPEFDFREQELTALAAYLRAIDSTGVYPPARLGGPVFGEAR